MGSLTAPQIHITCVYNYFDPLAPGARDVRHLTWEPRTVRELVEVFHPPRSIDGYDVVATIDGAPFKTGEVWDLTPSPGASVVFALVPRGGGSNPLATVAMLAVMVVAYVYAPPLGAAMSAYIGVGSSAALFYTGIAYAGIMIAGAALVNAVLPPGAPDQLGLPSGLGNSPTYGWGADTNAVYEGGTLPVLYGTHRVIPPRVGKYVSTEDGKQVLNLLFAVAGHALDAISNVEINDTPYEDYNDSGVPASVVITTRLGANDQTAIPAFLNTIAENPVGVELGNSWTTRQTAGNTAEALGLCLILPKGLYYAGDSGQLVTQSIDFLVEYRRVDDLSWTRWLNETISAADNSAIRKYYRADTLTAGRYDVRVMLTSTQNSGARYANDVYWESLQEIVYDDFAYPGVSLLAVKITATDKISGGIPTVACRATRNNVAVWNGSADVSKAANLPPWICCDILRNEEYGGQADKTRLVYAAFSDWADWCTENSLACNIYLDSAFSLRKALDMIGLLGRGNVVQMGSRFTCIVDKPEELPVQRFLFTAGNIVKDSFNIEWLPYEGRANALEVTYFDAEINYSRQSFLLKSHDFETTDQPVEPATLTLVGCTNRAMAIKHGTAQLKRNRYLTMMPTWTAAVDSIGCTPGDVVEVAHDRPQWGFSGRAVSATNNTITLDRSVTLSPGTTYMVTVLHASDDSREDRYVTAVSEQTTTSTLTLTAIWTANPAKYDQYSFGVEHHVTQLVRIGRITRSQEMRRKITALEYLAAAYDDDATVGVYEPVADLVNVADLRAVEIHKYGTDGVGHNVVSLTWRGQALLWQVFYREHGMAGPWISGGSTNYPFFEVNGLTAGKDYDFTITSTGVVNAAQIVTLSYSGISVPAPDVPVTFTAALSGQFITLAWTASADVRVKGYTILLNGSALITNYQGNKYVYRGNLTAGTYNFTLKAVDQYGQESTATDAASISILVPSTPSPSSSVIGELVNLTWPACKTSLPIDHYVINATQMSNGPAYSERINWAGAKQFSIKAVDIAGNESGIGTITVNVTALTAASAITATGLTFAVRLALTFSTFDNFECVEIWSDTVNNRANAVKVGESAAAVWTHNGLALIDTRYYWTRIRDKFANFGAWFPASATAGVAGSTSQNPADYLSMLTGSIDEDQLATSLLSRINVIDKDFIYEVGVYASSSSPDMVFSGLDGIVAGILSSVVINTTDINSLLSTAQGAVADISALQSEIAGLTTTVWSNTESFILGKYVTHNGKVWRCTQSYTYPPAHEPEVGSAYWEESDALASVVSSIDTRVDVLEGSIITKADSVTVDQLTNRVTSAESLISQNAVDILLRVSQTEFDAYSQLFLPAFDTGNYYEVNDYVIYNGATYRCILAIDFSPAPLPTNATYWEQRDFADQFTSTISQVEINSDGISLVSSVITGPVTFLGDIYDDVYVASVLDVLDIDVRITRAQIAIDGAEANIVLQAALISGLDGQLSQALVNIDGMNSQITLKASQSDLLNIMADLSAAELVIDGHDASITAQAIQIVELQATTGGHTTQISQVLLDLDAAETAITLRATRTEIDATLAPVYSALSTYNTGDVVRYNYSGSSWRLYRCKANGVLNILPTSTQYWDPLDAIAARVSTAETDINAGKAGTWSSISSKVLISDYNAQMTALDGSISTLGGRMATAETNVTALQAADGTLQSNINAKVAISTYDSKMQSLDGSISTLGGSMATAESNIVVLQTASGNMQAQYTLKLGVNNRIAGFGLMLSEGIPSEFAILADKFKICLPDGTGNPIQVFTVGEIGGSPTVGIQGNLIVDGSILTNSLQDNSVTKSETSFTAGSIDLPNIPSDEITIASVTITVSGKPSLLFVGADFASYTSITYNALVTLYRGTTALRDGNIAVTPYPSNLAWTVIDTPPAGSVTYYLKAVGILMEMGSYMYATNRYISTLETKK